MTLAQPKPSHLPPGHPDNPKTFAICGAKTRNAEAIYDYCTQAAGWGTAHPGTGRCKLHGGSAAAGPRNGRYINGRNARAAKGLLRRRIRQVQESDDNPIDLLAELEVVQGMVALNLEVLDAKLTRVSGGGSGVVPESDYKSSADSSETETVSKGGGTANIVRERHGAPQRSQFFPISGSDLPPGITAASECWCGHELGEHDEGGCGECKTCLEYWPVEWEERELGEKVGMFRGEVMEVMDAAELDMVADVRAIHKIAGRVTLDEAFENVRRDVENVTRMAAAIQRMRTDAALTVHELRLLEDGMKAVIEDFVPADRQKAAVGRLMEYLGGKK